MMASAMIPELNARRSAAVRERAVHEPVARARIEASRGKSGPGLRLRGEDEGSPLASKMRMLLIGVSLKVA